MKKTISIIAAFLLLLTLCSCGGGKPKGTSDAMYQIGLNALNAVDRYIAGEITGDTAAELLDEYHTQAQAQYDAELEEVGSDTLVGTNYANDYFIELDIYLLYLDVSDARFGNGAMSEVKESRDELAEKLGE